MFAIMFIVIVASADSGYIFFIAVKTAIKRNENPI